LVTLQKIRHALQQYRPKFFIVQRFETKGHSNFLNFIKKIEGENGFTYVMKLPKAFTDIICYLRIAIFHLLGDKAIVYGPFAERMKNSREKMKLLSEKGVPSLPLVEIDVEGVLVTKFVRGNNLKDIFQYSEMSFEEKLSLLSKSAGRLNDIHRYFSHGDAQVRNILLDEDREAIWLDYEYIANPEVGLIKRKARDLIFLIFSAAKHLGNPDVVVKTIINAYKDNKVKELVPSLSIYQSMHYNLFLNLLSPVMCVKIRKALKKLML